MPELHALERSARFVFYRNTPSDSIYRFKYQSFYRQIHHRVVLLVIALPDLGDLFAEYKTTLAQIRIVLEINKRTLGRCHDQGGATPSVLICKAELARCLGVGRSTVSRNIDHLASAAGGFLLQRLNPPGQMMGLYTLGAVFGRATAESTVRSPECTVRAVESTVRAPESTLGSVAPSYLSRARVDSKVLVKPEVFSEPEGFNSSSFSARVETARIPPAEGDEGKSGKANPKPTPAEEAPRYLPPLQGENAEAARAILTEQYASMNRRRLARGEPLPVLDDDLVREVVMFGWELAKRRGEGAIPWRDVVRQLEAYPGECQGFAFFLTYLNHRMLGIGKDQTARRRREGYYRAAPPIPATRETARHGAQDGRRGAGARAVAG